MKPRHDWHKTRIGRAVLFLGSVRFAVPLLALTACALMYGTWIESTASAHEAGLAVYGSWWFMALMMLICVTLVLAVVTRYPWRKKHTGFIIVHASLITIIVSGFVTLFAKVEGQLTLQEGMSGASLQTGQNELQILSHDAGEFTVVDASVVERSGLVKLNGIEIEVIEQWANSMEQTVVLNDGLNKLHAVEISFDPGASEGHWIGQLRANEAPPMVGGVEIRVLREGETWLPPSPDEHGRAVFRQAASTELVELGEIGATAPGGWRIESVQRFEHALVDSEGLIEGDATRDNPAIQVTLVHDDGSRERHAAFDRFRGSVNKKNLNGETFSDLMLDYVGEGLNRPTLALTRDESSTSAFFATPQGQRSDWRLTGDGPWTLELGGQTCTVLNAYANARGATRLIQAPQAGENAPALRVIVHAAASESETSPEPITLVWGRRSMIQVGGQIMGIAYAPATVPVPFSVELVEFRKRDYPGTEQAMAYESDVVFTDGNGESHAQTIWMNNPLEHKGWKIYQASFVGSNISIFQVTKDPGLIPMYAGCIGLCLGILVMYYSKAYSHGHPGMPKVFAANKRSTTHATAKHTPDATHTPELDAGLLAGKRGGPAGELASQVRADSDPGSRTHDADGHLRQTRRDRSHGTHKVG